MKISLLVIEIQAEWSLWHPVFNGNTPNQHSLLFQISSYYLRLWPYSRQMAQHISWSQSHSTSSHISKTILQTFTPSVNHVWQYYQTPKSVVASEQFHLQDSLLQFCLQNNLCTLKSKIAFSYYNSSTSTLVPLLGTPFNTISYFSDHLAYLPNTPQHSRWIYQRGCLSLRSLSSTTHSGQTVLLVLGLSIVTADNDHNWEDAPATNPITNLIANRLTPFTCSQSKPCQSNITNKQLANLLGWLVNTLNANQTPSSNTNLRRTKACILDTFSSTEPDKLNNFLFQCYCYFHANPAQFNIDIVKINFAMTYLTGVA